MVCTKCEWEGLVRAEREKLKAEKLKAEKRERNAEMLKEGGGGRDSV